MQSSIRWLPGPWSGTLGLADAPPGGAALADAVAAWEEAGAELVVSLLTDEEVAALDLVREEVECRAHRLRFQRRPVTPGGVPDAGASWRHLLRRVAASLDAGKGVLVHARTISGRASLVPACLLVARGAAAEDVLRELERTVGRPAPADGAQRDYVAAFTP